MGNGSEWEVVFSTADQIEIELMRGLLETSGITVVVEPKGWKSFTVYFGSAALGEYLLKVPPDQADLASEILKAKLLPESDDTESEEDEE